jgi:hypothetical protein
MNFHTAADLEAAEIEASDLLALARLDDDGAPPPGVRPRSQPAGQYLDNDRRAAARPDPLLPQVPIRERKRHA